MGPGLAHNLPVALSSFLGRGVQLTEQPALLDQRRVVTPDRGGGGKTRLAARLGAVMRTSSGWTTYVILTCMGNRPKQASSDPLAVQRQRLMEAEAEYRRARSEDYVARVIRDAAIVDAHRAGMPSSEISALIGDIGQPNVVRARRRAMARRPAMATDLLSPADAVRVSGLTPAEFIAAVRNGRLQPVDTGGGVQAFRGEDVDAVRGEGGTAPRTAAVPSGG